MWAVLKMCGGRGQVMGGARGGAEGGMGRGRCGGRDLLPTRGLDWSGVELRASGGLRSGLD